MKPHEVRASLLPVSDGVCCGGEVQHDKVESCFDDDDFYEAIHLLENARNQMQLVLRYSAVGPGRSHALTNLCDDIKQFIDLFIADGEEEA